MHLAQTAPQGALAADMRQFIIDLAEERTAETLERYVEVADDLGMFIAAVDVSPWLGRELADHAVDERTGGGVTRC